MSFILEVVRRFRTKKRDGLLFVIGGPFIVAIFLPTFSLADTLNLSKTGQTTCYDTFGNVIVCADTGKDGDTHVGVEWPLPRFTNNKDGTVTDNLTGLMWLKDANCANTIGHNPNGIGNGRMLWQDALDFISGINEGSHPNCSAGYKDWRLPNVNELERFINAGEPNIAAWLSENGFSNVRLHYYWSSTSYAYNTGYAWIINMLYGYRLAYHKTYYYYIWPVRAGQMTNHDTGSSNGDLQTTARPNSRFTDNKDGTVTDNLTGLMWLRDGNCFGSHTWQGALNTVAYFNVNYSSYICKDYTASYNDWRLSNREELNSLTAFSQYNPALPSGHPFTNMHSGFYWSSATHALNTGHAWIIYMWNGFMFANTKTDKGYIWPVRAGILPVDIH